MTRFLRNAVPFAVALALPHLAGCSPRSVPSKVTVEEPAFSFQVPSDWLPVRFDQETKTYVPLKEFQPGALQPEGHLFFMSKGGDFLYLEFDPLGHGTESDLEWTVEPRDDRFVLLKEGPFCTQPPPNFMGMDTCRIGDGRLDIQVTPLGLMLRGHHYFIQFGNVRREKGVDVQVFRDILASFRAK